MEMRTLTEREVKNILKKVRIALKNPRFEVVPFATDLSKYMVRIGGLKLIVARSGSDDRRYSLSIEGLQNELLAYLPMKQWRAARDLYEVIDGQYRASELRVKLNALLED